MRSAPFHDSPLGTDFEADGYDRVARLAADLLRDGRISGQEWAEIILTNKVWASCYSSPGSSAMSSPAAGLRRNARNKPSVATSTCVMPQPRLGSSASSHAMKTRSQTSAEAASLRKIELKVAEVKLAAAKSPARDPITLEPLGKWTWGFRLPGKDGAGSACTAVVRYNVKSLVEYLMASGDFTEPTARVPFSLAQIVELEDVARRAGVCEVMEGSGLLSAWRDKDKRGGRFHQQRTFHEMLIGADRCLGETVCDMRAAIECEDLEEGHVRLVTLFPQVTFEIGWLFVVPLFDRVSPSPLSFTTSRQFIHGFAELQGADPAFARQCLIQYRHTIRGPPNKPTPERGGLLQAAMDFLSSMEPRIPVSE
jgi:hypothetical protein